MQEPKDKYQQEYYYYIHPVVHALMVLELVLYALETQSKVDDFPYYYHRN